MERGLLGGGGAFYSPCSTKGSFLHPSPAGLFRKGGPPMVPPSPFTLDTLQVHFTSLALRNFTPSVPLSPPPPPQGKGLAIPTSHFQGEVNIPPPMFVKRRGCQDDSPTALPGALQNQSPHISRECPSLSTDGWTSMASLPWAVCGVTGPKGRPCFGWTQAHPLQATLATVRGLTPFQSLPAVAFLPCWHPISARGIGGPMLCSPQLVSEKLCRTGDH